MSENIRFKKEHFTMLDGYFYLFDDDTNVLYQRTADGGTCFSYPLDTLLNEEVVSLEHDGTNFWTLEPADEDSMTIKRWNIENYVCKKRQEINLNYSPGNKYDSKAFTIEHYHTTISGAVSAGEVVIPVDEYWDKPNSGMTITIGPNVDGVSETIDIQDTNVGSITLADPVTVDYLQGVNVNFYTNIWMFNNFDGEDDTLGALYKFNAYSGSFMAKYGAAEYKDVTACTFYEITALNDYPNTDMLCYVKSTNMLFVDVSTSGLHLLNFGSMLLDNVKSNDVDIIAVYDLSIEGDNIYKLQYSANYFGNTESYSLAQYHVATQTNMVTAISLLVNPTIISANGIASSTVTARVTDQFKQPVAGRLVYFDHDDLSQTPGEIITSPVNTDVNGEAITAYRSGTEPSEVKISATVDQL